MKIKRLRGVEILDSRANPTLQVHIELENGIHAIADVPSGASKGTFEAVELRDNDPKRFNGLGVQSAIRNVDKIFSHIKHIEVESQSEIDMAMINLDGTNNKSNLGANTTLGVSYAVLKAAAKLKKLEIYEYINETFNMNFKKNISLNIPTPLFNILNGGAHADNKLDFQEFMVIPTKYDSEGGILDGMNNNSIESKVRMGSEILHSLKQILKASSLSTGIGDEGGFAPLVKDPSEALNLISEACLKAGYEPYKDVSFGIDCASNYFYNKSEGKYILHTNGEDKQTEHIFSCDEMISYYKVLLENFPIIYIEDYMNESDFNGFAILSHDPSTPRIAYCGDDLTVTNPERLKIAIDQGSIRAMIVKPNQIGTVSETFNVVNMCIDNGIMYVPSHRSGETNDAIISDIAVGLGAKYIKAGAPQRGERVAKYNRLLEISAKIKK